MFKKLVWFLILIYLINMPVASAALSSEPTVEAPSALLFELKRGQILYAKNPDEKLHIAAASKLMTAYIALEKLDLNTMVTASKEAVNAEGALLELTVGEKYTAESLIYASMLSNANDATIALAEAVGGTVEDFVKLMNDYAASLDMINTVFVNPTGAYDENQYTTASDLAKLIRHAITTNQNFEKVFSSQAKPWFDENKTLVLTNLNDMFWSYDGVDGGKVDYNDPKYQTVITTVSRDQQRLVCILLDAPAETMYTDTIKLFEFGFNNFRRGPLVYKGQPLDNITVEGHEVTLIAGSDVYYTYPVGDNYIQEIHYDLVEDNMKLPLYKNTLMGTVKFTLTDGTVITVDLFPDREILPELTSFEKAKKRLMEYSEILYIIIGLCIVEILLLLSKIIKFTYNKITSHKGRR
ncbi:D-alanyl-D-alanine carboxypeptidase DacB [Thermoclostridium stercorarium subsp. stercorarium DSM 8532]|uniref:serine-type D-Ala-D-Ala carboxypeptidase n=1 Tax=Thermoclostridium stercorarium (strain ATCC 35414 / DSM 8532 / NCIMB 11754) TaxID=1121335 RepID=L7VR52_THES1|nr:D-alanyl-D-alanine carboxypeptidase family protein [Thermoclostridium stercorarium]AGC69129.1 D-alanyl-D-alanine carboxypeptidase DacB [Thermoclostridium stercorarium subsp. stercorarium DSM 8532]AGI40098.1 D-alanyl-D-alanine carboxypeptidase [Thermoclostridium stercorarium subsp. stercorarium DSM 8532]